MQTDIPIVVVTNLDELREEMALDNNDRIIVIDEMAVIGNDLMREILVNDSVRILHDEVSEERRLMAAANYVIAIKEDVPVVDFPLANLRRGRDWENGKRGRMKPRRR